MQHHCAAIVILVGILCLGTSLGTFVDYEHGGHHHKTVKHIHHHLSHPYISHVSFKKVPILRTHYYAEPVVHYKERVYKTVEHAPSPIKVAHHSHHGGDHFW